MSVKVFVLGRPGSGKTTAVFQLLDLAQEVGYEPIRVKDYDILFRMLEEDNAKKFRATEHGGFDVLDVTVLDDALKKLEEKVYSLMLSENRFITIEFARDDYKEALRKFSAGFLKNAYIIFLDTDVDICSERIHKRVTDPPKTDSHFVSDYILHTYYGKDNWNYMAHQLGDDCDGCKKVFALHNTGSKEEFLEDIRLVAKGIFKREQISISV